MDIRLETLPKKMTPADRAALPSRVRFHQTFTDFDPDVHSRIP
jgi:hypothetical protein